MKFVGKYHHHKETMAWVAFTIYLGSLITILTTIIFDEYKLSLILTDEKTKIFFIIIVIAIEISLAFIVIWEFWHRRMASYRVSAYFNCIAKFLKGDYTKNDFEKKEEKLLYYEGKLPKIKSVFYVPEIIEKEFRKISNEGELLWNEKITYFLIALTFLFLLFIMVIKLFP